MNHLATFCFLQFIYKLSSGTHHHVVLGSTVELPCLSFQTDITGATITWKFNGQNLSKSPQSPGMAKVKKDGLYLSIFPVTTGHGGLYVCSMMKNDMELINSYNIEVDASLSFAMSVVAGATIQVPCYFSPSSQVKANALWLKETESGQIAELLNQKDGSEGGADRWELLYPDDHDQTIIFRNVVMDDAGKYTCVSPEGQKLSSVSITVKSAPTAAPHSCTGFTTAWEPCQEDSLRTAEPLLQESLAEFSFKLYSYLRESNPSDNLLFSPISISGVLSHLLLGARGDTRRDIHTAVCVPVDFLCVHVQMKKLREKLADSLQMASQMYYNPEITLSESFTNQSMQFYDAEPIRLMETSEENTQMINSWVANKTNNKITQLLDSVSPNSQLILLNAVSFSGQWKMMFEEKPKKGHFTKLDGDLVKVPLLYRQKYLATLMHVVELKAQVARFALSGDNSLYILLPNTNTVSDLHLLEERMTDVPVSQMIRQMEAATPQHVEVTLPKIQLDEQLNMNILLNKLGLSSLFEGANLCGLYPENKLVLDDARHRAVLELNEQGVEASAATAIVFSRSYPSFSALRPFILLLWNDLGKVPLFIGRVTEP